MKELNYPLLGKPWNKRQKKNISPLLSASQCDSIQPIRLEWLLSSDIIFIISFIFVSMKLGVKEWGKQMMKKLPDGDKGRQK